jgi:ABC-type transport system involved in multi-copper enzyme maturation permease subunit
MTPRAILLVARGVWLEALRRREIYVIVALCCALILGLAQVRFFGLDIMSKFYREIALKLMGAATVLTVIVLGTRQLPREFSTRTIYPLLARPVTRTSFLLGKQLGVAGAGVFCLSLFMGLFLLGSWMMGAPIYPGLLLQHYLLQILMIPVLTSMAFMLSLLVTPDAAFTFAVLYALVSSVLSNLMLTVYDYASAFGRLAITGLTWALPQLMLFDLSEKYVHGDRWDPLSAASLLQLALYALVFTTLHLAATWALFRRRPL